MHRKKTEPIYCDLHKNINFNGHIYKTIVMANKAFCKNCFNQFTKETPTQKYCSKRCENEYNNSSIINNIMWEEKIKAAKIKAALLKPMKIKTVREKNLTCRYCHKIIKYYMVNKIYCSKKCRSNYLQNIPISKSILRYCVYCNKQFVPKKDEITKFCSVECRKAKQKKVSGNNIG